MKQGSLARAKGAIFKGLHGKYAFMIARLQGEGGWWGFEKIGGGGLGKVTCFSEVEFIGSYRAAIIEGLREAR